MVSYPAMTGTITKRVISENACERVYGLNDGITEWLAREDAIELINPVSYTFEFEYCENVVVARFFEVTDNSKTELGRGHGHIIHEDAKSIAQAASYALKKLYEKMNNGKLF